MASISVFPDAGGQHPRSLMMAIYLISTLLMFAVDSFDSSAFINTAMKYQYSSRRISHIGNSRSMRCIQRSSLSYSASDLLYQDQQDARSRRAAVEKDLLGSSKTLKASKVKKAPVKRGSGFGGGAKQDSRTPAQRLSAEQAKIVRRDGVLRIDGALNDETCGRLRSHVLRQQELADAETAKNVALSTEYYGVENRRKNRCDLLLSLVPNKCNGAGRDDANADNDDDCEAGIDINIIPDVMQSILGADGTLRPIYEELVTNSGEFYEFAAVITDPGSDRQQIHPDLPHRKEAPLYVVFLALQDITEAMGPTTFLLGTHTHEERLKFEDHSQKDEQLSSSDSRLALLSKGDAVLFDARILHCGNANDKVEGSTRAMFNFSFRNPKETGNLGYCGSMRPGYVGALTLGDVGAALADYRDGNMNPFEKFGNGLMH